MYINLTLVQSDSEFLELLSSWLKSEKLSGVSAVWSIRHLSSYWCIVKIPCVSAGGVHKYFVLVQVALVSLVVVDKKTKVQSEHFHDELALRQIQVKT